MYASNGITLIRFSAGIGEFLILTLLIFWGCNVEVIKHGGHGGNGEKKLHVLHALHVL